MERNWIWLMILYQTKCINDKTKQFCVVVFTSGCPDSKYNVHKNMYKKEKISSLIILSKQKLLWKYKIKISHITRINFSNTNKREVGELTLQLLLK